MRIFESEENKELRQGKSTYLEFVKIWQYQELPSLLVR
jgi:hypothetical protein